MNPAVLDDESEDIKEVFAYYGLATYSANCLERGIVNLIVTTRADSHPITNKEIDLLFDKLQSMTMGQLKIELEGVLSSSLIRKVQMIIKKRNWLAHSYFAARAANFAANDSKLRLAMKKELYKLTEDFKAVNDEIERAISESFEKKGLDLKALTEHEMQSAKPDFSVPWEEN